MPARRRPGGTWSPTTRRPPRRTGCQLPGLPGKTCPVLAPRARTWPARIPAAPTPPPLPRLDPASKGAWAALFGGPLYLLIAVMAGWQVPNWAAFCAVAAFVGGFATLVVRMGDRPPRDSGP